jgi:hypothetical protein
MGARRYATKAPAKPSRKSVKPAAEPRPSEVPTLPPPRDADVKARPESGTFVKARESMAPNLKRDPRREPD